jgi:ATP-dependent DNA helicase RecQ
VEEKAGKLRLSRRRLRPGELAGMAAEWQEKDRRDREKLERVEAYARSAMCRWRVLREYFGEDDAAERCSVCDNCKKGLAERAETWERSSSPTSPATPPS